MTISRDYYEMNAWTLEHSIEIAKIGAGREGYRAYDGGGGIWAGGHNGMADGNFTDWGLARATAEILNAAVDGRLVPAASRREEWLRSLLKWCRPRLKRECYQQQLDKDLAAGPAEPDPEMQGRLVQS